MNLHVNIPVTDMENHPTEQTSEPASGPDAQVWGFMGGTGGVGVTSLCVQLAFEYCKHHIQQKQPGQSPPKVLLFDLDFEAGMCTRYLHVRPSAHIEDLAHGSTPIDENLATSLMSTYEGVFDVLAVPNSLSGNASVNPAQVLTLLDTVCHMYDLIILDIPRLWTPWTHATIGAADKFFLVSELTIPALHATKDRARAIRDIPGLEDVDVNLIINKYDRRPLRNSIRMSDAEKAFGGPPKFVISSNFDPVRDAINRGEPVSVSSKDSRYAKDTRLFLLELMASEGASTKSLFASL